MRRITIAGVVQYFALTMYLVICLSPYELMATSRNVELRAAVLKEQIRKIRQVSAFI